MIEEALLSDVTLLATWGRGDGDDKDKDNNNGCPGPGNSDDRGDDRGNDSNPHHGSPNVDYNERDNDTHISYREDHGIMIQNTQQTSTINSDGELYPVARQMTLVRAAYADAIDLPDAYDARPLVDAISQHVSNDIEDDSDYHSDFDDSAFVIDSAFDSGGYDGFDISDHFSDDYDSA